MIAALAVAVTIAFVMIAVIHVYWAFGGRIGRDAAIPKVAGRATFAATRSVTLAVALALLLSAALVASVAGLIRLPVSPIALRWAAYLLAALLLLRAIGEFRLLGFFKRVRGSRFARLDTWFYSPLCVVLAAGIIMLTVATPECTITDFGIVERGREEVRLPAPETTSGYQTVVNRQDVIRHTADIPATLHQVFGFQYRLRKTWPKAAVTAVVTHPPIKKPDGTLSIGFASQWDTELTSMAYALDLENEVVPGSWELAVAYLGTSLCSRKFNLAAP